MKKITGNFSTGVGTNNLVSRGVINFGLQKLINSKSEPVQVDNRNEKSVVLDLVKNLKYLYVKKSVIYCIVTIQVYEYLIITKNDTFTFFCKS